jgi:hypothetical protein
VSVVRDEEIGRRGREEEPVTAQIPQLAQTREEDGDRAHIPQPARGERGRTQACASGKGRG